LTQVNGRLVPVASNSASADGGSDRPPKLIGPDATQPEHVQCDHGLRRQTIVASLLADVFQGRLRAGQHLVTRELAVRFGVSHTPIREALIALAGIGVIDLLPNRGAIVRRVGPKDIHEVCQVRRVLECEAVRTACGRIEPAELDALAIRIRSQRVVVNGTSSVQFIAEAQVLDSRLHDLISASSGNTFLANEMSRLKILFRAFRDVSWAHDEARNDFHRIIEESHEHLAIVEALRAGNRREAVRAMSRHIMGGVHYWSRALRDVVGDVRPNHRPTRVSPEERPR
jgi:DNA-binding GntR family transcriptional regulator